MKNWRRAERVQILFFPLSPASYISPLIPALPALILHFLVYLGPACPLLGLFWDPGPQHVTGQAASCRGSAVAAVSLGAVSLLCYHWSWIDTNPYVIVLIVVVDSSSSKDVICKRLNRQDSRFFFWFILIKHIFNWSSLWVDLLWILAWTSNHIGFFSCVLCCCLSFHFFNTNTNLINLFLQAADLGLKFVIVLFEHLL